MGEVGLVVVAMEHRGSHPWAQVDQLAPPAAHELEPLAVAVHLGRAGEERRAVIGAAEQARGRFCAGDRSAPGVDIES